MTDVANTTRSPVGIAGNMVDRLKSGIAESRATTVIAGGKPLLRMLKDSNWVYGQSDDPVQEGSSWAINPMSICHGHVAWTNHQGTTKNTMVGEVMAPVYEPKPPKPAPVDGWPFTEQRMFELRCMDGEDEGTEVVYKTSSVGGMRAADELLGKLQAQLSANPNYPCPVLQLLSDSYQHTKWGKTYVPILELVDWATMDGDLLSEANGQTQAAPAPAPQPEPAKPPLVRRRAAAAQPEPAPQPAPSEPAPTARRRPLRR